MTSADREALRQQLIVHEGLRLMPYLDTVGKWTIGCGRNLSDRGISNAEARYLLDNDITIAINARTVCPWFPDLGPGRQRACVDLVFNLGLPRFRTFKNMLAAIDRKDWPSAAAELLSSRYATQVGARARTVARMLETGEA